MAKKSKPEGSQLKAAMSETEPSSTSALTKVPGEAAIQSDSSARDPALYLYRDNFVATLYYLDTFEIAQLEGVSRLWKDYIVNTPELWRTLDLRRTKKSVPFAFVKAMAKRAGDTLAEVYLHNVPIEDAKKSLSLILRTGEFRESEDKKNDIVIFRSRLRKLFVEGHTKILEPPYKEFSSMTWSIMYGLREVQLTLDDLSSFMKLLLDGKFQNVTHLTFYSEQHAVPMDQRPPYTLDFLRPVSHPNFKMFPRVKSLSLGGRSIMSPTQRAWYAEIGARTLQRLVWLFPGLSVFKMSNILLVSNADLNFETLDPPNPFRLDFRVCSELKEFNIAGSTLSTTLAFPILPTSVEKLILHKCSNGAIPRTVISEDGIDQYADNANTEVMAVIADEYKNLKEVDLGGVGISGPQLIDFLARCDPQKLQTLSIDNCYDVKFMTDTKYDEQDMTFYNILEDSDYIHNTFDDSLWQSQLLATIFVDLVPHLKRLRIGLNYNIDGVTLRELQWLRELEYLDVSGTQVSVEGLVEFIGQMTPDSWMLESNAREAAARRKRYEVETKRRRYRIPESKLPEVVPWEVTGRMTTLKSLVLNNCEYVPEEGARMLHRAFNLNVKWNGRYLKAEIVQPEADAVTRLRGYFERHMRHILQDESFTLDGNENMVEEEWNRFREGGYVIARSAFDALEDDYTDMASFFY
ncbi:uncharacterized protein V2V93DRAFT_364439 [Kockiozyma suomiensis]|uniref:uncharacterized protein n=1 Tax=Kockiozyma suomiensis TaxID=1337062 RepID=UPI003343BEBA